MKNRTIKHIAALLLLPVIALSQTGGEFTITRSVVGASGAQNASGGNFAVKATAGQPTAGVQSSGGDFALSSGFWVAPVSGVGSEGDVAPRPAGDGSIFSNDVVQARRYFNGTATPDTELGEFQRADSAPRATGGDGVIASNDVVQIRRYQNGTDAVQPAAGPLFENAASFTKTRETTSAPSPAAAPRELRVESTVAGAGQTFTLNIRVDAMGDEAEYGFRLNYQSTKLANPIVGAGSAGASVRACNTATAGSVNCSVGGFPVNLPGSADPGIGEIPAGNNQILLTVTFNVLPNAAAGASPLTLVSVNASNDNADLLAIGAVGGAVTISGPTAANVAVGGRVLTAEGFGIRGAIVVLTSADGAVRTTSSSSFGNYRFEGVPAGEIYTIAVRSKRFRFAPRVVSVVDEIADLDLTAEP